MTNIRSALCAVVIVGVVAAWSGCADLKNSLPTPTYGFHEKGWTDSSSTNFHGSTIRNAAWDMRSCKRCHGAQYDGGTARVSCRTCHTQPAGPEACTTCHGSVNPAPPKALDGSWAETLKGVGAHQEHLMATDSLSSQVKCSECHSVPQAVYAAGHLDVPAAGRVVFNDTLANLVTAGGSYVPHPAYDAANLRCNNTYCHGAWRLERSSQPAAFRFAFSDSVMSGANYAPRWTAGEQGDSCGSCHGLPPAGHVQTLPGGPIQRTTCYQCHSQTVDQAGNILDRSKHVNGKINAFDRELHF